METVKLEKAQVITRHVFLLSDRVIAAWLDLADGTTLHMRRRIKADNDQDQLRFHRFVA